MSNTPKKILIAYSQTDTSAAQPFGNEGKGAFSSIAQKMLPRLTDTPLEFTAKPLVTISDGDINNADGVVVFASVARDEHQTIFHKANQSGNKMPIALVVSDHKPVTIPSDHPTMKAYKMSEFIPDGNGLEPLTGAKQFLQDIGATLKTPEVPGAQVSAPTSGGSLGTDRGREGSQR